MPSPATIFSSARLIAVCTLASRVTGMIRDMLLVHAFGASKVMDAFSFAFAFPNLFRRLFGEGALAAVFVPTFTRTLESDGREPSWKLLARTVSLLTMSLGALIGLVELVLLAAWFGFQWIWPDATAEQLSAHRLLVSLTALMAPFMLTICLVALFSSLLNCLGSFGVPALMPLVLNAGMIVGLVWVGPALHASEPAIQVYGVAASVVAAGGIQLGLILLRARGAGVKLGWSFAPRDPAVRGMLRLMTPVALGQGVLLLSAYLDAQLCWVLTQKQTGADEAAAAAAGWAPLAPGSLTVLYVAQRLYQFPLGVLGISVAIAALPALSRLAARADWVPWAQELRKSLRLSVFIGLLSGCVMVVAAEPIVRLLFEYARFDAGATARAARVLSWYGVGMWAFCAQHLVLRGFYSLGDVRTPLYVSGLAVPLNVLLSVLLVWLPAVREAAFAIATTVTSTLCVLVSLALLQRGSEAPILDRVALLALLRMLAAAVAGALATWGWMAWSPLAPWVHGAGAVVSRAVETGAILIVGIAAFLAAGAALGLPEWRYVLLRRRRRGAAATSPSSE